MPFSTPLATAFTKHPLGWQDAWNDMQWNVRCVNYYIGKILSSYEGFFLLILIIIIKIIYIGRLGLVFTIKPFTMLVLPTSIFGVISYLNAIFGCRHKTSPRLARCLTRYVKICQMSELLYGRDNVFVPGSLSFLLIMIIEMILAWGPTLVNFSSWSLALLLGSLFRIKLALVWHTQCV